MSTACMLACMFDRLPNVDPPAMSLRFAKVWNGTSARRHRAMKTARLNASLQ